MRIKVKVLYLRRHIQQLIIIITIIITCHLYRANTPKILRYYKQLLKELFQDFPGPGNLTEKQSSDTWVIPKKPSGFWG